MKTKVLFVPAVIIASGFLAINQLKPTFDLYVIKRIERDVVKAYSEKVETVARNSVAQKAELDANSEKKQLMKRFVPSEQDEARALDNFNFLVSQSGLVTSQITIQPVEAQEPTEAVFAVDPSTEASTQSNTSAQDVYVAPKAKKFMAVVEGIGGYSNIKELTQKLMGYDRLHDLQSLKITVSSGEEAAGTLTVALGLVLPYQAAPKTVTGGGITNIPHLQNEALDFSVADAVKTKIDNPVPDFVLGTDGKSNPFE